MDEYDQTSSSPGIWVTSVGVGWHHPVGFVVDRPSGVADYTFVHWLTPALLRDGGGERQEPEGGCIVFTPGEPQYYGGIRFSPFANNWFHFNGSRAADLLAECGMPLNRPFHLRDAAFVEPALRKFLEEILIRRLGWRWMVSALAADFFVGVGRALLADKTRARSARNLELAEKFEAFRDHLKASCTETWTVGGMAAALHLSPSRFSNLYREFFDAKPVDDLIHMRVQLAEYYLRTTSMPIGQIATMCGFSDVYYFSRVFRAKTGKTATAFRDEPQI